MYLIINILILLVTQYLEYKINYSVWNLRNETIKYCLQDCISLYQIIYNFNTLIFDKYHINIHKFPTLSSLTFGIYRTHYLKDHKIPLITGQIFNDIKLSYTGGSTDMYKPYGFNIYRYDVNSLYSYVMKSFPMPVGNITFFEGNIFKDYINHLYKKSSNKNDPMYLISNLLMNSLYGRFGLNEILFNHEIINEIKLNYYNDNFSINEIIPLNNNKILISYFDINNLQNIMLNKETYSNISIGIASAISAYARIHMSQFKNNPDYNLYYTDTDSIFIDKPLQDNFRVKGLGKMKLEYNLIEATFLSSKVYGGLCSDNN
jgi:hypothetical protein